MIIEVEKPRVTEIQVRMDCNGCVQKIKKALHGVNGIYDMHIDLVQQKLTIVGWADPERIIKAIKRTRKTATICSHAQVEDPKPPPKETVAEPNPPATEPEKGSPSPAEAPPAEAKPSEEPTKEPPPPQSPPVEAKPPEEPTKEPPPPQATDTILAPLAASQEPKNIEAVHIIHHWHDSQNTITHCYNNYKPSPSISCFVMGYGYPQSPQLGRLGSHESRKGNGDQITSMFSDENPNACTIA